MTARKIVIRGCGECPSSDHKGEFGAISRIPVCRKADCELPWTTSANRAGFVSAKREPGIPDWCPLPNDANDAQELEQASERFQWARMTDIQARERAEFSASQWQQRAELAERQRDELAELLGDRPACQECGGSGQDIAHGMCVRCGGTEKDAT